MPSETATSVYTAAEALARAAGRGVQRFSHWRSRSLGVRGMLLYWLALPMFLATLVHGASGDLRGMLIGCGASALLLGAARFNRLAIRDSLLERQRRFATPKQSPYRPLALIAFAAFSGLTAWGLSGHGAIAAMVYALLAALGLHLAYPLVSANGAQVPASLDALGSSLRAQLQQAEERLLRLRRLAAGMRQAELASRLDAIATIGGQILLQLAGDPELVRRSQRFLHVHLEGAERVAKRYAGSHRLLPHGTLESRFRDTLVLIEKAFRTHQQMLARQDVESLDIQISVLQQQLRKQSI